MSAIVVPSGKMKEWILSGLVRLKYDTIKCALFNDLIVSSTVLTYPQIAALEIAPTTTYTIGGKLVPDIDVQTDPTTGKAQVLCGSLVFDKMNTTLTHAVIYSDKVIDGFDRPIIMFVSFGSMTFTNTQFKFRWPTVIFRW
jgi:hypothetical protein